MMHSTEISSVQFTFSTRKTYFITGLWACFDQKCF